MTTDKHDNQTVSTRKKLLAFGWEILGLILVAGVIAGAVFLMGCRIAVKKKMLQEERDRAAAAKTVPATPVVATVLEPAMVVDEIRLPGLIRPWLEVKVSAEVSGRVVEKRVEDGDVVKKGQVICRIDNRNYVIACERDKAALRLAEANFKRTKRLFDEGVKTPAQLDVDRQVRDQARTKLAEAELALERCAIASPIDGVVDNMRVEAGELLANGTQVAKVIDTRKVKVEIGIPEKDVIAAQRLRECDIVVDAVRPGFVVKGKRIFLSLAPMQQALVYLLRLEVDNAKGVLRPGMLVEANIVKARRADAIVIPLYAVLARKDEQGRDTYLVFVAEGNAPSMVARRREVRPGIMQGRNVEILSGLKLGDRLIVMGQRSVEDGTYVEITRTVKDTREIAR